MIKLIAYSLLGYVLYELYLGITAGVEANARTVRKNPRGSKSVNVDGGSGAQSKRTVGRGVV